MYINTHTRNEHACPHILTKNKVKHFYFTTVTAKLKASLLAVDISVLPPAKLVLIYMVK